jgi:DNA-binding MarR family transcriptional regulator
MTTICPHCGQPHTNPLTLTPAERDICEALLALQRGSPVTTTVIADYAGFSYSWAAEVLRRLEKRGIAARPFGKRSGWVIPHRVRIDLAA